MAIRPAQKQRKIAAATAAFALIVAACGDNPDQAADAASAGVARSFCDAVADLGATIQSDAEPTAQASAAAATVELMPTDAPEFARSYFQAIADTTQIASTGGDSSAAQQAWADGQHLQVSAFLGSKCPDDEFTSSASFQGMIAMGMEMQTTGVSSAPVTADDEATTATTAAAATDDDDDQAETTETTTAPATVDGETTEFVSGVKRTKLFESSNSGQYAQVEWTLGEIFNSDADQWSVFTSEPELGDNDSWLIVEVNGETLSNISTRYGADEFFLISPDGMQMNGEKILDRFGESVFSITFDGKENKSGFLLFDTPTLVQSVEGWEIAVVAGDQIPTFIPVIGTPAEVETEIALTAVPGFVASGSNTWPNDCQSRYQVDVLSSAVTVESVYKDRIHRARVGERYLVVQFDAQNVTEAEGTTLPCGAGASHGFDPEYLRISVDGRVSTPEALEVPNLDPGDTVAGQAVYIIPNTATELQIVGETDAEVHASWNVAITTLRGE